MRSSDRDPRMWTRSEIADLTRLVELGLTSSQVAKLLNKSRSAVMGKISRLGLKLTTPRCNRKITRRESRGERSEPVAPRVREGDGTAVDGLGQENGDQGTAGELVADAGGGGEGDQVEASENGPCDFWGLRDDTCRWPLSGGMFCGAKSSLRRGAPYCLEHSRRAGRFSY